MKILSIWLITILANISYAEFNLDHKAVLKKNITQLEDILSTEKNPENKFVILSNLVKRYSSEPLTPQRSISAKKYADECLQMANSYKSSFDYGNALHHAHLVLGRVHLFQKDLTGAKQELELAAQTPGSPQLASFGPNMTLAKELLEKGEKDAVFKYFDLCTKFWKSEFSQKEFSDWKTDIKAGKIPNFRGNLVY